MAKYIDKNALVAEIEKRYNEYTSSILKHYDACKEAKAQELGKILTILGTLEVKDHYEQCVQYDSIKAGIQAHAETYSFNIESELFHQLTKEQQELWRKEIEQACISGGDAGYLLAKDTRYKENLEVKKVDNTIIENLNELAVNEIKSLYTDIDECIMDLISARSKHDSESIENIYWRMEVLMVNTQQVISYILKYK